MVDGAGGGGARDAAELEELGDLLIGSVHEHVEQLAVCRTHAVGVHDLVPPPDLKHVLEELFVLLEVAILHQLLPLPVVLHSEFGR